MRKPITRAEYNAVRKIASDALRLASHHDPEHESRLQDLERQVQRLGAPEYRTVRKGRNALAEIHRDADRPN